MILALWSEEDDALLIKLANEHKSAAQIANEIPGERTRNAIIGRIGRLRNKGIDLSIFGTDSRAKMVEAANKRCAAKKIAEGAKKITLPDLKVERREDVPAPQPSEAETIPVPTVAIETQESPSNHDLSTEDKASSAAAPQGQAAHAGIGSETLAGLEGHCTPSGAETGGAVGLGSPIHFMDLREGSCRQPLWGHRERPAFEQMMFCDRPKVRGSYCAEHAAIHYQTGTALRNAPWYERRSHG